ncbi:AsnC family transcriptional regulator [Methanocaldococcus villosus KIN24-T80]|uniref:AsnC family transcriptional regulator n=1 Tax=Methanocaldococcus villosus KIN24-T80 TaxID=1069083 RepID=N6UUY0_9EURY|nr:Lrp/AsnC family transcriptional regulator [Methanocaldococcus villosus]ENN96164.1 AsnC family transcriptional regulator [Methanocaldococcus villosus KIN24-T80]
MLDEKDRKILEILMKDARKPFTEIAKELNTSESSIRKRIKKMEENGIIKGYTVVIEPAKIGYNVIALTGFDTDPQDVLDVAKELCKFEEVKKVFTSTGDHMIMTEIWARDGSELKEILFNKIGKIKGIKKICPAIILERLK